PGPEGGEPPGGSEARATATEGPEAGTLVAAPVNKLSCQGRCGQDPAQGCSCAVLCEIDGDCCKDKGVVCDGIPADSCANLFLCGGLAPSGCSCELDCAARGTCCPDALEACSCKTECNGGGLPTSGCTCGLNCWMFGICCEDAFQGCGSP
ncbi:MAG TPA: hypothetical protein VFS00_28190, partial [Polyangiaceae bacterium]|nr:hypothetical protein [Polyangiaceae bacterium]